VSRRVEPPFRADHVGSLLRPKSLLQAREAHKRGELSSERAAALHFRRGLSIPAVCRSRGGEADYPVAEHDALLDDTSLAYLNDAVQREYVARLGGDRDAQHLVYIDLINGALAGRPPGMTVCTHLCRGNFRSSWVASGGYDYVAEALFGQLRVDGYFLEYDDERSGGFEPLRYVPRGKFVVLGLVSSKRPQLESKDSLKRRIEAAAKFVPLEQLCLSPQCGFSSTQEGNSLTLDEQIAKLRLVVETAREVWD
jgi:5-methyltetrahydropteroyltriglutamate--homocysteine methyltransferase